MWYVYFLELSNGDIYVGSTDDLRRRIASHQQKHVVSTGKFLPAILRTYVIPRTYVAVGDEVTARRSIDTSSRAPERHLQRNDSCQRRPHERE